VGKNLGRQRRQSKESTDFKIGCGLFNQPAVEAAMKWKFTPAIMNNGPVSVWVSIHSNSD